MYRRSGVRFELNTSAVITTSPNSHERFMLKDVSCRGVGIIGYQPFKLAEKVLINFQIPAFFSQPIRKNAKVAWSKQINGNLWEAGLDFGLDNILDLLPLQ
jgi:hypothetical protein